MSEICCDNSFKVNPVLSHDVVVRRTLLQEFNCCVEKLGLVAFQRNVIADFDLSKRAVRTEK